MKKLLEFFRRITNRAQPSRKAPYELAPEAKNESSSIEGSTAKIVREFEVGETSTGRFHFAGVGGQVRGK